MGRGTTQRLGGASTRVLGGTEFRVLTSGVYAKRKELFAEKIHVVTDGACWRVNTPSRLAAQKNRSIAGHGEGAVCLSSDRLLDLSRGDELVAPRGEHGLAAHVQH